MKHQVVVGNIGTVYGSDNGEVARREYFDYVKSSKSGKGRAGGEDVTWFKDGDINKEFLGSISQQEYID